MPALPEEALELRTMKEWGILPATWRKMSMDDRAQVMAFELVHRTQEAYRQEWKEERRKKQEKGPNPYEQMKASMGLK